MKLGGTEFAIDAFQVVETIQSTDPDVQFGALSNYNNTQTTPNGVGYVEFGPGWNWQQRDWTEYNSDIHYAQWDGSEATIHFNGTGIVWEGNTQGVVDFYLDGVFVKQTNMGALGGRSNQVGYEVSGLPPGNHTLRFMKVGGTYVEFDNFRVYNDVNDQWTTAASYSGASNGDLHSTPNNEDFISVTFNGHSADIISRRDPDGGTARVTLDQTYGVAVNHYRSIATDHTAVYSTLASDLLGSGNHTLRMVKKRGPRMFLDAIRVYKQWPSGTLPANVLLTDHFNSSSNGASTFNSTLAADQQGPLAPVTYAVTGQDADYKFQHGNDGQMLMAGWHGGQSLDLRASLNHNFAADANAADMPLKVRFNLKITDSAHITNWAAIAIGSNQNAFVTGPTNTFSSLFRHNGGTQQFASGGDISNGAAWNPSGSTVEVVLSDTAGYGSPFNGKGSVAQIHVNSTPVGTWTLAQMSASDGYVSFEGYGVYALHDNLSVSLSLPEIPTLPSDYDTWNTSNIVTGGPADDDDHDGASNTTEYAFGLDPKNGGSCSAYLSLPTLPTGTFSYTRRKTALSGMAFSVWTSTNLTDWTEDTGASQTATAISGSDNESVRVTLSPGLLNNDRLFVGIQAR